MSRKKLTIDLIGLRMIYDNAERHEILQLLKEIKNNEAFFTSMIIDDKWKPLLRKTDISTIRKSRGHVSVCGKVFEGATATDSLIIVSSNSETGRVLMSSHTIALGAIGRPVTALIENPYLDENMIIENFVISQKVESWMKLKNATPKLDDMISKIEKGKRP